MVPLCKVAPTLTTPPAALLKLKPLSACPH
jgi:hypothetical protein